MMANVAPWEYLAGVGIYVWTICMAGAGVMATGLEKENILFYLLIMGLGFVISIVLGGCIGIFAKKSDGVHIACNACDGNLKFRTDAGSI